jgi:Fe2+ transport system protein FeoA
MVPLHTLKPGQEAQVVALRSADAARLDRLGAFGLVPGSTLRLEQLYPTLIIRVGETEVAFDAEVGREIWVSPA